MDKTLLNSSVYISFVCENLKTVAYTCLGKSLLEWIPNKFPPLVKYDYKVSKVKCMFGLMEWYRTLDLQSSVDNIPLIVCSLTQEVVLCGCDTRCSTKYIEHMEVKIVLDWWVGVATMSLTIVRVKGLAVVA